MSASDPLEALRLWMALPCAFGASPSGACCGVPFGDAPLEPPLFERCLREGVAARLMPGYDDALRWGNGVFFDASSGRPIALVFSVMTDQRSRTRTMRPTRSSAA